jgi:Flp pilus assembly protein TadD
LAQCAQPEERLKLLHAIALEAPIDPQAHYEYAKTLAASRRDDGAALQEFRRALALDPQHAKAQLGMGALYHRLGELELAEAGYTAATRLNPRLLRAWMNLGSLCLARGDYRGARRAYAKAAKLRPRDASVRRGLGRALSALGKRPEALAEWETAQALDADDPATLKGLAKALGAAGDPRAPEVYERAIAANPESLSLPTSFARLLERSGEHARAEEVLRRALAANPSSPVLWRAIGGTLRQPERAEERLAALREGLIQTAGDERLRMELVEALAEVERLADAVRELRPIILGDPRNARARRLMAAMLAGEGRHDEAVTAAQAALRIDRNEPSPRLLLMHVVSRPQHPMAVPLDDDPKTLPAHRAYALAVRGALQLALQRAPDAGRLFDLSVKASPETALPRVGRALAYLAVGNLESAHAELRTAAILQPSDAHVQHLFGESAFHLGNFEEAGRAFQAALADESVDASLRAYTFFCRARAFRKRGLTREAIDSYLQAERLDPEYSPSFFGCGKALQETGKMEEALRHYERCVSLSPRHSRALQGQASCLARLGRAPEAVEAYRAAIAADPAYPLPRYNLAVLLDRAGDPTEVASLLRRYLRSEPRGPYADDARRRLRVAELRLAGAIAASETLPDNGQPGAFLDSSQEDALFEVGGRPPRGPC